MQKALTSHNRPAFTVLEIEQPKKALSKWQILSMCALVITISIFLFSSQDSYRTYQIAALALMALALLALVLRSKYDNIVVLAILAFCAFISIYCVSISSKQIFEQKSQSDKLLQHSITPLVLVSLP